MSNTSELIDVKKAILTDSEKEVIAHAYKQVVSKDFSKNLYFKFGECINFKKEGFKNQEDAIIHKTEALVKEFLTVNNYLDYIIMNAHKYYERFKKTGNKKLLNAIENLMILANKINKKEYSIHNEGKLCYPATICKGTDKETREWFLKLLEPLLNIELNVFNQN